MELVDQAFEFLLLFKGKPQLKLHMVEGKVTGDGTAIVVGVRFRTRVASESSHLASVNDLRDQAACLLLRLNLSLSNTGG